ncbi:MAG: hypothetical protein N2Z72_03580 [Bacteroidales bacterium]|nr:hypothetical protein [Bacteroidales bacterium]
MKKFFTLAFLLFNLITFSQNEYDALRYSYLQPIGTARYSSLGGSYNAIGADISTLFSNPAGLGVYKISEFTLTPGFTILFSKSSYLNSAMNDNQFAFKFPNIGVVFVGNTAQEKGWTRWQIGFGINSLASFNRNFFIEGHSPNTSIVDVFYADAIGTPYYKLDPFSTQLAYNTYLIDTVGTVSSYERVIEGGVLQQNNIYSRGGGHDFSIAFAGSFEDKLYLGIGLGIPSVRFKMENYYKEYDDADTIPDFKMLSYNNYLTTKGSGINARFGLIYQIGKHLRLGMSFHTPSSISLKDNYNSVVRADLETNTFESSSPQGIFKYRITTPFRFEYGVSILHPYIGLFSISHEMVNYYQARIRSTDYSFSHENENITSSFKTGHNIKAGVEIKLPLLAVRGGFAWYGSPYKLHLNDASTKIISGGMSYREKLYFFDISYSFQIQKVDYYLYNPALLQSIGKELEPANLKHYGHYLFFTIGFKIE